MTNKPEQLTDEQRWCPDVDPITRYPLFMWISHPELGYVPIYGGPYDSYTLTERDSNGEFFRHRYDHDFGGWVEDEYIGVIVVEDWLPKDQAELDEYVKDNLPAELQERRKADSVKINDDMAYAFHHALSDSSLGADEVEEIKNGLRAAFANVAAPQPALKDHQIRELVNELRDIAVKYHGTQQLRERIARTVSAAMLSAVLRQEAEGISDESSDR